jgi:hypothetical protein
MPEMTPESSALPKDAHFMISLPFDAAATTRFAATWRP